MTVRDIRAHKAAKGSILDAVVLNNCDGSVTIELTISYLDAKGDPIGSGHEYETIDPHSRWIVHHSPLSDKQRTQLDTALITNISGYTHNAAKN